MGGVLFAALLAVTLTFGLLPSVAVAEQGVDDSKTTGYDSDTAVIEPDGDCDEDTDEPTEKGTVDGDADPDGIDEEAAGNEPAAYGIESECTPSVVSDALGDITNVRTGATYDNIAVAVAEAQSGDTIKLGEGNYTLYGVNSAGHTKGKDLTFEGSGTDKTSWNIGAEVPDPAHYGTEYNGDYSFDGAGIVTFKNMTLRSGSANYLGFIRANNTVVDGCVINGKTFYWGYQTARFTNTTFIAPSGDYAIWTYSSPTMTFDHCTFNASGKVINVYTDFGAGKTNITLNVNACTFNSTAFAGFYKQALNINDSNMGQYKYIINLTGDNAVKAERENITCTQMFGFGGKSANNSGRTDVSIDGKLVWSGGKMLTHDYTDGEHEGNFVDQDNYVWEQKDGDWYCTAHAECGYCKWPMEETVKATFEDMTSCTENGERVYTATFEHQCFKPQTKTEVLDPLGHDWAAPEYSWAKQDDGWYCTAKRVCSRDASHVEEETVKASYEVNTPATTESTGLGTYTAVFENQAFETQTKTEEIAKLPVAPGEPSDTDNSAKSSDDDASAPNAEAAQSELAKTNDAIAAVVPFALVIVAGAALFMVLATRRRLNH